MGRGWPRFKLGTTGRHAPEADPRAAWLYGPAPGRELDAGSMILADELAERRARRAAFSVETDALRAAGTLPAGWGVWHPRDESAGWLDPAGPDHERPADERRLDELDELDQFGLLGPAVQLAARELDAAGGLERARAVVRGALGVLDDIARALTPDPPGLDAPGATGELDDDQGDACDRCGSLPGTMCGADSGELCPRRGDA